jgi:hypothetical protein
MQIFCLWIIRKRILVHKCCNAFLALSFRENFRESFVFSSQIFRENEKWVFAKTFAENENENFRPNPSIANQCSRSRRWMKRIKSVLKEPKQNESQTVLVDFRVCFVKPQANFYGLFWSVGPVSKQTERLWKMSSSNSMQWKLLIRRYH